MNDKDTLRSLLKVSTAQYDKQRQALVVLIQQENALRYEITRLSALNEMPEGSDNDIANMRAIGADLRWRGWLGRAKSELNMQLARILAAKENEQLQVRRAFGKVTALRQLLSEMEAEQRKKRAKDSLALAIDHSLRVKDTSQLAQDRRPRD